MIWRDGQVPTRAPLPAPTGHASPLARGGRSHAARTGEAPEEHARVRAQERGRGAARGRGRVHGLVRRVRGRSGGGIQVVAKATGDLIPRNAPLTGWS